MTGQHLREIRTLRARCDEELRALIRAAARSGSSSEEIAAAMGLSRATLWRHYRRELRGAADPPPGGGSTGR